MGERVTPECDIFKTLQPKGLYPVYVKMWRPHADGSEIGMVFEELAVGMRGLDRIKRMVKAACEPPKKHKPAAAEQGADDA